MMQNSSGRWFTIIIAIIALLSIGLFIQYPEHVFQSSLQGVRIWWRIVFPSLLPFFILNEMLLSLGTMRLLSHALEPLTRKIWGLHGSAGWAIAIGWSAGFPAAARIASELRREQAITRQEGERMLALAHMCNPAFIIIVVATGFLHDARIGWLLLLIQWSAVLVLGILLRLLLPIKDQRNAQSSNAQIGYPSSRNDHNKTGTDTFGKIMGDAVKRSIDQLMMIGGIIIFFSVAITLIQKCVKAWESPIAAAVLKSMLETHIGTYELSLFSSSPYVWNLAFLGAAISWSGIAAHVQVQAFCKGTDLRYTRFLIARLLHSLITFMITLLIAIPLQPWLQRTWLVFSQPGTGHLTEPVTHWFTFLYPFTALTGIVILFMIISKWIRWHSRV